MIDVFLQGLLKLDKPFPQPSYSEITFPYCEQHQQCSCCNASHVVALQRSLQTHDAEPLSEGCNAMTAQLACRICDPEVGTGQKQHVCAHICQQWYSRCRHDYFSYSTFSQHLVPCGTKQASAVCSTAAELANNAHSFCQQAGYDVMERHASDADGACFDGSVPSTSNFGSCTIRTQRQQYKSKPGSSCSVLFVCFVLSAIAALLLMGRRIASIILRPTAQTLTMPVGRRDCNFPGNARRLRD